LNADELFYNISEWNRCAPVETCGTYYERFSRRETVVCCKEVLKCKVQQGESYRHQNVPAERRKRGWIKEWK